MRSETGEGHQAPRRFFCKKGENVWEDAQVRAGFRVLWSFALSVWPRVCSRAYLNDSNYRCRVDQSCPKRSLLSHKKVFLFVWAIFPFWPERDSPCERHCPPWNPTAELFFVLFPTWVSILQHTGLAEENESILCPDPGRYCREERIPWPIFQLNPDKMHSMTWNDNQVLWSHIAVFCLCSPGIRLRQRRLTWPCSLTCCSGISREN